MKAFVRAHKRKIIAGHGIIVFALLASGAMSLTGKQAVVYFAPEGPEKLQVGETIDIDVNVNASVPINAFGATLSFPQNLIEVVGISKEKSFLDLWTEETAIKEHEGQVHFSGGTLRKGGLTGVATAITITVRAKSAGEAQLQFDETQVLANNGKGEYIESEKRKLDLTIDDPMTADPSANTSGKDQTFSFADFNGTGTVSLVDMSILTIHLFAPYDGKYDLNKDGILNLSDLSVFFVQMQKANRSE